MADERDNNLAGDPLPAAADDDTTAEDTSSDTRGYQQPSDNDSETTAEDDSAPSAAPKVGDGDPPP